MINQDTMRQDVGETETESYVRAKFATAKLLSLLIRHHAQDEIKAIVEAIPVDSDQDAGEPIEVCILPIEAPFITVDLIKRMVCRHYGITHNDIISARRDKVFSRPRMIATYLCREFTAKSYPDIAQHFNRDHTSAISATKRVKKWIETDPMIAADVKAFSEMLT
jgi:chromosomal replication initiator protein